MFISCFPLNGQLRLCFWNIMISSDVAWDEWWENLFHNALSFLEMKLLQKA